MVLRNRSKKCYEIGTYSPNETLQVILSEWVDSWHEWKGGCKLLEGVEANGKW